MLAVPIEGLAEFVGAQSRIAAGPGLRDVPPPGGGLVEMPLDLRGHAVRQRQGCRPRQVPGVEILVVEEEERPGRAPSGTDPSGVVENVVPGASGQGSVLRAPGVGRSGTDKRHVDHAVRGASIRRAEVEPTDVADVQTVIRAERRDRRLLRGSQRPARGSSGGQAEKGRGQCTVPPRRRPARPRNGSHRLHVRPLEVGLKGKVSGRNTPDGWRADRASWAARRPRRGVRPHYDAVTVI